MHPHSAKKRNTPLSYQQLSQQERYTITALLRTHCSLAAIAKELGRPNATISRELQRNRRPTANAYCADVAHSYATARRKRTRRGSQFSPEQWCNRSYAYQRRLQP